VTLKDRVFISPRVTFIVVNHKKESITGTCIYEDCFIGVGTIIGMGVLILPKVIVGAMAFVNKNIIEAGTYVGCPVRRIK
jgi:acetyltransferase-like isoleucine patch superfamily enzyme